ncbi:hypothetical protein [Halomonas caseinilytica]|uniref:hypothetical protein n=1 Tax=Halomonas caseinilytica TaxID=438744 RepID=UPI0007E587B3|nr:hypothetical protein [Halomonas caseinilytica]SEM47755.1 hypothetical protein SAMN04487952_104103 [Halomonas caseinilytica]
MTFRAGKRVLATLVLIVAGAYTALSVAADTPSYTGQSTELTRLDNGLLIQGGDLHSPDRYTSGFRLTAGFTPAGLPSLDLGAELSYRESDDVPFSGGRQMLIDTTSLGGSLIAGVRLGDVGLYAKSGLAGWEDETVTGNAATSDGGTTQVEGFGARWQFSRLISQIEYERFDDPTLSHLNLVTASVHMPF